jgi:hypothetical protein
MIPRSPIRLRPGNTIAVPRYLVPIAKKIQHARRIMRKGLILDSPTVSGRRHPDGRVELKLR